MKAVICTAYGAPDVLQLQEVETPTPKDNEIRVKVRATPVNFGDALVRNFSAITPRTFTMPVLMWLPARIQLGINKPRQPIFGSEFAGVVDRVGKDVTRFKVGDEVFGYRAMNFGANAEYMVMPETALVTHKPANMTFEEASTLPYGALTALSLLRKADIQPGQNVLINGASGNIGAGALQLAKHYGARVTGVCATPRMGFVKTLGADRVIDYRRENFTQNGEQYDLIFDIKTKVMFEQAKKSLTPNGKLMYVSFKMKQVFQMLQTRNQPQKVICALSGETLQDLETVKSLAEAGVLKTVIDRCFPLAQTADAHRYYEAGEKHGSIVIQVA